MNGTINVIHESLVNGQRRQMVEQIDNYGVGDFWAAYRDYLGRVYVEKGDRYMYFLDAVISYHRIKARWHNE